ncbi:MAG: hypothetical protein ACOCXA_07315 [Planctomycetota bacterium]
MPEIWPEHWIWICFGMATLVILVAGPKLSYFTDVVGDRFRIGKTLTGAVLLGATTSLPGIVTSVTAA